MDRRHASRIAPLYPPSRPEIAPHRDCSLHGAGTPWGRVDALTLIAESIQAVRAAGLGYGLELLLGGLAGLAVQAGDLARAARLFQLIPEGFEDLQDVWVVGMDPTGSLRAEMRAARQALGPRARCAPDREAVYDEVLDLALGRPPGS